MPSLKGLGKQGLTPELESSAVRKYLDQFAFIPILDGQELEGTIVTGATFAVVRHSLGRAYRGGMVVGQSHGFPGVSVQIPTLAAPTADPKLFVTLRTTAAAANDVRVRIWLY